MNICVSGWYFYLEFYKGINKVANTYPVTVVAHREIPVDVFDQASNVAFHEHANIGLEFGAYQSFLDKYWDGGDTLFVHDDLRISDLSVIDRIAKIPNDQSFIFADEFEGRCNQNFHGRAFFCSGRFLKAMQKYECGCKHANDLMDIHHNRHCSEECAKKAQFTGWDKEQKYAFVKDSEQRSYRCPICGKECLGDFWGMYLKGVGLHKGFFVDPWNTGHHRGKPPVGVRHYNEGIYHFASFCAHARNPGIDGVNYESRNVLYFPEIISGKRGVIK